MTRTTDILGRRRGIALRAGRTAASWRRGLGLLPLYGLVCAAAVVFTSRFGDVLGAWPLLTVAACPLLHAVVHRR